MTALLRVYQLGVQPIKSVVGTIQLTQYNTIQRHGVCVFDPLFVNLSPKYRYLRVSSIHLYLHSSTSTLAPKHDAQESVDSENQHLGMDLLHEDTLVRTPKGTSYR